MNKYQKLAVAVAFCTIVSSTWAGPKEKARIKYVSQDGSIVKLDNGEKYTIDEKDRQFTSGGGYGAWRVGHTVEIDNHPSGCDATELHNVVSNSFVCAR